MAFAQTQPCYNLPANLTEYIFKDINYLASDALEGRKPGSEGALLARDYIVETFTDLGLSPAFKDSYFEEFTVPNRVDRSADGNYMFYKSDALKLDEDFYPVYLSGNGQVKAETEYVSFGIESAKLDRDDIDDEDVRDQIAVMELSSPDGIHPHSKYKDWHDLAKRIKLLKSKGAKAVILIHTEGNANPPDFKFKSLDALGIPVVYVRNEKIAKKLRRSREVEISVSLNEVKDQAFNVAARIDNGARNTIIIGAHYDHLGMGGEGSRYLNSEEPMVHNGADDNASGTSGLLTMARFLASSEDKDLRKFNYLFIAFSAEEMGLLGSKHFVKGMERFDQKWLYMLNMDMIGRMEESTLALSGVGTSPMWADILASLNCGIEVKMSESGVGPSDHTSFYYQDIPVLHFFTGTHADYHKPSDDVEKINFDGIFRTLCYLTSIIRNTPAVEDFPFSATKVESTKAPKFSVTLGVMPDYLYNGNGMKLDGVSPDKPAFKAGLKAGDIITQLGEVQVSNMQTYMEALAQFKAGDKADLLYQRDGKTLRAQIQF